MLLVELILKEFEKNETQKCIKEKIIYPLVCSCCKLFSIFLLIVFFISHSIYSTRQI